MTELSTCDDGSEEEEGELDWHINALLEFFCQRRLLWPRVVETALASVTDTFDVVGPAIDQARSLLEQLGEAAADNDLDRLSDLLEASVADACMWNLLWKAAREEASRMVESSVASPSAASANSMAAATTGNSPQAIESTASETLPHDDSAFSMQDILSSSLGASSVARLQNATSQPSQLSPTPPSAWATSTDPFSNLSGQTAETSTLSRSRMAAGWYSSQRGSSEGVRSLSTPQPARDNSPRTPTRRLILSPATEPSPLMRKTPQRQSPREEEGPSFADLESLRLESDILRLQSEELKLRCLAVEKAIARRRRQLANDAAPSRDITPERKTGHVNHQTEECTEEEKEEDKAWRELPIVLQLLSCLHTVVHRHRHLLFASEKGRGSSESAEDKRIVKRFLDEIEEASAIRPPLP
eukprot:TRINITY_DN56261_c0_g1_i1.p1 TRINITY_DN56261_c0_g1~~TRINITY_DN56261_c0_g1_i1.p1  ORF type:complete len:414 (-),score=80.51 TRINITY_DN56261_c0_g1_i1:8-1249(-)